MPDYASSAKSILCDLLAAGPVRGARLKLLFAHAFETREGATYQDAFGRFLKFSDLLAQHQDILQIEWSNGPGDITVRLRKSPPDLATQSVEVSAPSTAAFMRPELWQAFTNPDPRRRRFINRVTGEIVHFIDGSTTDPNPRLADRVARDASFVELRAISADEQKNWIQEFITSDALPETRRRVVVPILDLPYSSQVNTLLLGGLGEHAEAWRAFRAARVFEHIKQWCSEKALSFDAVLRPYGTRSLTAPVTTAAGPLDQHAVSEPATARPGSESDLRRSLRAAIDDMSDEELGRVLLPASTLLRIHSGRSH